MRLLIQYLNGYRQDAILLATMENRIRVAEPGRDDAMEFRFLDGHWISEALEPVEIEEGAEIEFSWGRANELDLAGVPALRGFDYRFGFPPASEHPSARAVN